MTRGRGARWSVLAAAAIAVRPRLLTWGATEEEQSRPLPGDGLIPNEGRTWTMATSILAPPSAVWPWLAQMGCDRAGWYSWDHLDNGGRSSADVINPAWQHVEVGDRWAAVSSGKMWFVVARVEPVRSLVLRACVTLAGRPYDPQGPRPRRFTDSRWEFFLDPLANGGTRLLVRTGGTGSPRLPTAISNALFWHPAHVIMQVRQLRRIRRRAEALAPAECAVPRRRLAWTP